MSKLSREYISESEDENGEETVEFAPPSGFSKCKHLKKFHKKKEDEQLWLIKVPASLNIANLKSLPLDFGGKEGSEAVIRSDEGRSYNVSEDVTQREGQDHSNLTLLVPDESRESLAAGRVKHKSLEFDRVFSISEVASIPDIDYEKVRVPRSDVVKVEGLKVKHFATGYDEEQGDSKKRSAPESAEEPSKKHSKKDKKDKKAKKDKKDKKEKKSKQ